MRATTFDATDAPWDTMQGTKPVYVVSIDWPSGEELYGTWGPWTYGGDTIQDRIISLSGMTQRLTDAERGGMGVSGLQGRVPSASVTLRDNDKTLWIKLRDESAIQGRTAKVYLAQKGANPKYFKLFEGVISAQPMWTKGKVQFTLSAGDFYRDDIGNLATTEDFPNLFEEHRGRMLPIVYGQVHKVPAVAVQHGGIGALRESCTADAMELYIDGFQDVTGQVTLMIGDPQARERVTGEFQGSKFVVTQRGGGTVASGTCIADTVIQQSKCLHVNTGDLGTVDNAYVGYLLKMTVPQVPSSSQVGYPWSFTYFIGERYHLDPGVGWGVVYRPIYRYDATNGYLWFTPAFTYEDSTPEDEYAGRSAIGPGAVHFVGHIWLPHSGDAYTITTMAMSHERGDRVIQLIDGGTIYVAADHPCAEVRAVFAHGRQRLPDTPRADNNLGIHFGGGPIGLLTPTPPNEKLPAQYSDSDWLEIPPEFYTVNANDTTTFPGLGRAITTIKFQNPIQMMPGFDIQSPELWCNIKGDDTPSYIENPVTILERILTNYAPTLTLDSAAFTAAATSVSWLRADFAITEPQDTLNLAADMAWQCRCRTWFRDGQLSITYLRNIRPAAHSSHFQGDYEEGSHAVTWRGLDAIVTELEYKIHKQGEEQVYKEEDTTQVAKYGRRGVGTKDFWIFEREAHAQAVARFWLNRMKYEAQIIKLRAPLDKVRVELGDWLKIYPGELWNANQYGEVISVDHIPVDVAGRRGPSLDVTVLKPYGWEAPWTCPGGDTAIGCGLYCDAASDVLACVVAADVGCDIYDLGGYVDWLFGWSYATF